MTIDVPPLFSSESSVTSLSSNRNGPALPLASTVKFFMSPAWCPSGLSNPCFLPSGLKWPPADLKSGPSHFGTWWKWMACSPGVRSWTVSSSPTECGPLAQRTTPPTTLPCASLSSTCVLAALSAEQRVRKRDMPKVNDTRRFMGKSLLSGVIIANFAEPGWVPEQDTGRSFVHMFVHKDVEYTAGQKQILWGKVQSWL